MGDDHKKQAWEALFAGQNFQVSKEDFKELPVTWEHSLGVQLLPDIHFDPFDRLLISQAKIEDLVFITRDKNILKYELQCMEG